MSVATGLPNANAQAHPELPSALFIVRVPSLAFCRSCIHTPVFPM